MGFMWTVLIAPGHLILRGKDIFGLGKPAGGEYDPQDPVYRMPFMQMFLAAFPATSLGAMDRFNSRFSKNVPKNAFGYLMEARTRKTDQVVNVCSLK